MYIRERSKYACILSMVVEYAQLRICLFVYFSTCFNRIDLPLYDNKKDLQEKLRAAITLSAVGFDME